MAADADDFHRRYSPRVLYMRADRNSRWWQVYVNKRRRVRAGEFVEVMRKDGVADFGVVAETDKGDWIRLTDPTTLTLMEHSLGSD